MAAYLKKPFSHNPLIARKTPYPGYSGLRRRPERAVQRCDRVGHQIALFVQAEAERRHFLAFLVELHLGIDDVARSLVIGRTADGHVHRDRELALEIPEEV